jgi:V/A-type H+-transporting ATPase subunit E
MADSLENLLNRIQKEGVEKAEEEAARIIEKARGQAAQIIKESEAKAKENLEKAEQEAKIFTEQSIKTIDLAGRDLIIAIGCKIESLLRDIVFHSVGEELSPETMTQMMIKLVSAYEKKGFSEGRINMLLSPEDQNRVVKLFMEKYRDKFRKGIEIDADENITRGFKVSFKSDNVFHDFTRESIAESLCFFLKPHLAEIIHRVANSLVQED